MVADSDHPSIPARRLAERLRDLREGENLTQKQLARALAGSEALSDAMVSLWEKDRLPPPPRLASYARLFCTRRSFESGAPRLLGDEELEAQERDVEMELYDELIALRERAQSTGAGTRSRDQSAVDPLTSEQLNSFWRFPAGATVSIVAARSDDAPPYADQSHLNYSRYSMFADLDSLVETFGQVKADNPTSRIRTLSPEELTQDFALNHLIIVGGAAWRTVRPANPWLARDLTPLVATPWRAQNVTPPIAQQTGGTYTFECSVGDEKRTFESLGVGEGLTKDVGLIARVRHPAIPGRTVILLNGITSRGVHGATLCFTDSHVKEDNERYLQERFGNADEFCVVMNVIISNNTALPPNLWQEDTRLWEWSPETGPRWTSSGK